MKVGLCGVGDRLGYLAGMLRNEIGGFEPVAYADPGPVGLQHFEAKYRRRMKAYRNLESMLESEKLDLIMIGSPNHMHYNQLRLTLQAGVRVFCEKPVVISEEQTFGLLELLRQCGTEQVLMGFVLRYAPLYVDLLRMADSGLLGEIVSLEASEHIDPAHGAFFFRDWRRRTELSGGFLLEKCCHDLDLYARLVNSRARRVASFGGCGVFNRRNRSREREAVYGQMPPRWREIGSAFSGDGDIVDHQVALIEYENEVRLSFHTNVHAPDEQRRFCVIGSRGMADGDFVRGYLKAYRSGTGECVFESAYDGDDVSQHYGAERQMARGLAAHFERGDPLPVSVIDGLAAGLTALKIDEARVTGRVVDLTGLWQRFDAAAPGSASAEDDRRSRREAHGRG